MTSDVPAPFDIAARRAAKEREDAKNKYSADVARMTGELVILLFPDLDAAGIVEASATCLRTIADTLDRAAAVLK